MTLLVQMRQSNKCGSVMNDEIINLTLEIMTPTHLLIPSAQTINRKKNKESRKEIQLPTNRIILTALACVHRIQG